MAQTARLLLRQPLDQGPLPLKDGSKYILILIQDNILSRSKQHIHSTNPLSSTAGKEAPVPSEYKTLCPASAESPMTNETGFSGTPPLTHTPTTCPEKPLDPQLKRGGEQTAEWMSRTPQDLNDYGPSITTFSHVQRTGVTPKTHSADFGFGIPDPGTPLD
ncbi:hypothetical protein MJT46_016220 [Ovis ammon polii x Ovis aries]|nr:hypothetical protein MJT46_016220 [Ovis ammon polii x Ovis aries]